MRLHAQKIGFAQSNLVLNPQTGLGIDRFTRPTYFSTLGVLWREPSHFNGQANLVRIYEEVRMQAHTL